MPTNPYAPPTKLRDSTPPYTMYNNQDRALNLYYRAMTIGGFEKAFTQRYGDKTLYPATWDDANYTYESRTNVTAQYYWATTAIATLGWSFNNKDLGAEDRDKAMQAEGALARQFINAAAETTLLIANIPRWSPTSNLGGLAASPRPYTQAVSNELDRVARVKQVRNYVGATTSAVFTLNSIIGTGLAAKNLEMAIATRDKDGTEKNKAAVWTAGLGMGAQIVGIGVNATKGLSSFGSARGWNSATTNKLGIAGSVLGAVQLGLSMSQLIPLMLRKDLTDEQRAILGAEMGVQILGGVTQIVSNAALAAAAARGITTGAAVVGPALGAAAGALVLALSPLQIYGLVQQSGYADKLHELGEQMSAYGYSGDGMLGDFYDDKTALEGGLLAATTTLAIVGSAVSIAAAASVVGAPVAVITGLATAIASAILSGVQQEMIESLAEKYAKKIEEAGGPEVFFEKNMAGAYNKMITDPKTVDFLKGLQEGYGVDSVVGVTTTELSATARNLAALTYNSDNTRTENAYINRFIDGLQQADGQLKIDPVTGILDLGAGISGHKQLLMFTTPLMAPGEEKRQTVKTGKNEYKTTVELILAAGGWRITDGADSTTLDLGLVMSEVVDSNKMLTAEVRLNVDGGPGDDYALMGVSKTTFNGGTGNNTVSYMQLEGGADSSVVVTPTASGFQVVKRSKGKVYQDTTKSSTETSGKRSDSVEFRSFEVIDGEVRQKIDTLISVQNIYGSDGNDKITGNGNDNVLMGGAGRDTVNGGAGNDRLVQANLNAAGKVGSDQLDGGDGIDTVDYSSIATVVGYGDSMTNSGITADLNKGKAYYRLEYFHAGTADHWDTGDSLTSIENVVGTAQDDAIIGNGGANALWGAAGNDTLSGGGGADTLIGGAGKDSLTGGAEDDIFLQGFTLAERNSPAANDIIDGGDGIDTLDYLQLSQGGKGESSNGKGVYTDLAFGRSYKYYANEGRDESVYDTLNSIENVTGTEFSDTLLGGAGNNVLNGDAGNDSIDGGAGNDQLVGGTGSDTLRGGDGDDYLIAGGLPATLSARYVMIWCPPAADWTTLGGILNLDELQVLDANGKNIALGANVSQSNNTLGGGGERLVDGSTAEDLNNRKLTLSATDQHNYNPGPTGLWVMVDLGAERQISAVTLYGSDKPLLNQNVTVFLTKENPSNKSYTALLNDAGVQRYQTGTNDAIRQSWSGNPSLDGQGDVYDGGSGIDFLDFSMSSVEVRSVTGRGVAVNLETGSMNQWSAGGLGADIGGSFSGIEGVTGTGVADVLVGDATANTLRGLDGNDTLSGSKGNDSIAGGKGDDVIDGGDGDDMLSIGNGFDTVQGGAGDDLLLVEDFAMRTGQGSYDGGAGENRLDYALSSTLKRGTDNFGVQVDLAAGTAQEWYRPGASEAYANKVSATVANIQQVRGTVMADALYGDAASNIIEGGESDDVIEGRGGDDILVGGGGRDTVKGGDGNDVFVQDIAAEADVLDGGAGTNTLDYSLSKFGAGQDGIASKGVKVDLAAGTVHKYYDVDNSIRDTISNFTNVIGSVLHDVMTGDAQDNIFEGAAGNDTLTGAAGNDTLSAGSGRDSLSGGDGDDLLLAGDLSEATMLRGRYVMIWRPPANNGNTAGNVINLSELQVYDGTGKNVAQGKPVTHSSNVNIYGNDSMMAKLVDGGVNTAGANDYQRLQTHITNSNSTTDTVIAPSGSWVMVDLGEVMDIAGINLIGNDNTALNRNLTMFLTTDNPSSSTYDALLASDKPRYQTGNDGSAVQSWTAAIKGNGEADTMSGGAGIDTLDYSQSSVQQRLLENRGVQVDLATGTANQWYAPGHADGIADNISGIENVTGSAFDDVIAGSSDANVLEGGMGNDVLSGGGGADTLDGGTGADSLAGGDGDDLLAAGSLSGVAELRGRYLMVWRPPVANAGASADYVLNLAELEVIDFQGKNVALNTTVTYSANVMIHGGDQYKSRLVDGVTNTAGANDSQRLQTHAATGTNYGIAPSGSWVMVDLGKETEIAAVRLLGNNNAALNRNMTMFLTSSDPSAQSYTALMADKAVARYVTEQDGRAEQYWTSAAARGLEGDVYSGEAGNDTLSYAGADQLQRVTEGRGVKVDMVTGTVNAWYAAGHTTDGVNDTMAGIENVVGSIADDILLGDSVANVLEGGAGDDSIDGAGGADTLSGGSGADTLAGGGDDDRLIAGDSISAGSALYGRYVMIWRPPANNGNTAGNVINLSELQVFGMDGKNVAQGKTVTHSGNVNIYGHDPMMAKLVDGTVNTAGANDYARLQTHITNNNSTTDTVIAPSGAWVMVDLGAEMEIAAITLFGNDSAALNQNLTMFVTSSAQDVNSYGEAAYQALMANAGVARYHSENDGRAVQTWAANRKGSNDGDAYDGGAGTDTLDYSQSSLMARSLESRGVKVDLGAGTANQWYRSGHSADAVTDTITGVENVIGTLADDILTGNSQGNLLSGGAGNDSIDGDAGNDTLGGGTGADTVAGGAGDDLLVAGDVPSAATALRGRYVMIWRPPVAGSSPSADYVLNLSELKVLDASGNNVAQGRAVSMSSNILPFGSGTAYKLIDGVVNTAGAGDYQRFQSHLSTGTNYQIAPTGSWVMVDLGAVTEISAITLYGNDTASLNQSLAMFVTSDDPTARTYDALLADKTVANYRTELDGRAVQTWTAAINLGAEADRYDGGVGNDTLDFSQSAITQRALEGRGVAVDLGQGTADQWYRVGHSADRVGATLAGIENLVGTMQDDVLSADANANVLTGGAGTDVLTGGDGSDTYVFNSGDGSDTVVEAGGAAQVDTLCFGAGISSTNVTVETSGSNMVVRYGAGDAITVTAWRPEGDGSGQDRAIERFVFDDGTVWDAAAIASRIRRVYVGTDGNDTLNGGVGDDTISGLGGNDVLNGGTGSDVLTGGAGNDTLDGGAGEDTMIGGSGNDTYVVDFGAATDPGWDRITEEADSGTDTVLASLSWTISNANLENLTLTGTGAFNGTGNAGNNVLRGNTGANVLSGLAGDDTLEGGGGADTLAGGAGNDSLTGGAAADTYQFNLGDGRDTIVENGAATVIDTLAFGAGILASDVSLQQSGNDLLVDLPNGTDRVTVKNWYGAAAAQLERFTFADGTIWDAATIVSKVSATINGTAGNDVLAATSQSTRLYGLDGNDKLTGGGGNDLLDGGAGSDSLIGGLGNDTYVVDSGDTITENANAGTDTVVASLTWTIANVNLENLTLSGSSAISGTGNTGNNVLQGNSANNTLTGLAGNDTLYGNDGNDSLLGGEGDDLAYGGNGNDSVFGGAGNDSLYGGDGNDVLGAGAGTDVLNGGAGNDTYQFNVGDGADVVTDHDATAGNSDAIQIGEGVAIDQLWFSRADNDLRIDIVGKSDRLTVANWFGGSADHIELIKNSYGRSLTDSGVAALVQAMAGFSPPAAGTASIPTSNTTVTAALAANWQ